MHERIIILDFGGQYAHLIASRIRRSNVLAEIFNPDEVDLEFFKDQSIKGIILSGGPQSVYDEGSAACDPEIFNLGKPVLGICYGHQFLSQSTGGKVVAGQQKGKEFGRAELTHNGDCPLFKGIPEKSTFWMSHGDEVEVLGNGFTVCGTTALCHNAAVWNADKNLFGIQFHPEVTHSEYGSQLLQNFIDICAVKGDWTIEKFYEAHQAKLKAQIGDKNIVLFVSGGVDSTVAFALLSKILGPGRVRGLFVDNGLLRQDEVAYVEKSIKGIGADLTVMRESDRFLGNLKGLHEPEEKRKVIGNTFLEVQRAFFADNQLDDETLLAQGTIYPDTIETGGTKNAVTIKTHHNRVPEIQKMIDEGKGVRVLCAEADIDEVTHADVNAFTLQRNKKPFHILPIKSVGVQGDFRTYRHPAILKMGTNDLGELENMATKLINHYKEINRCIHLVGSNYTGSIKSTKVQKSDINDRRVAILQRADHVVTTVMQEMNLYNEVWQFPVVLAPMAFNDVGQESVILRPIDSIDAMSASVGKLPWEFFEKVSEKILKDDQISAVFVDVTSKPPGTIEWE